MFFCFFVFGKRKNRLVYVQCIDHVFACAIRWHSTCIQFATQDVQELDCRHLFTCTLSLSPPSFSPHPTLFVYHIHTSTTFRDHFPFMLLFVCKQQPAAAAVARCDRVMHTFLYKHQLCTYSSAQYRYWIK